MKVLNFGSLNLDYVYSVEHMVMAGETLAASGANRSITKEFVDEVLAHFEKGNILLLQNEINMPDISSTGLMKKE